MSLLLIAGVVSVLLLTVHGIGRALSRTDGR
jgi:hypothetical protein